MPATLTKVDDTLLVDLSSCRGSEFQDAKEKVKDIPGRRWDPETKNWILPADPRVADRLLKTVRPEVEQDVMDWILASLTKAEETLTTPLPPDDGKLLVPWAYKRASWQPEYVNEEKVTGLLDYQRPAVKALVERRRAILADDVGLGKTIMILSAIEEYSLRNGQVDGPKLIVAPASVMGGWPREIRRWMEPEQPIFLVEGKWPADKRRKVIQEGIQENGWIIVNIEQLRVEKQVKVTPGGAKTKITVMKQPLFEETEWLAVVADEVHYFKNPAAAQSKGLWRCQGQVMVGATATAIMNSPDELWSPLRWLYPNEFHEQGMRRNAQAYWSFYNDYVDYYEDHFKRKVITGVKNPDALRFLLKDKLMRRTGSVLGNKGRKRIYVPMSLNTKQRKLYDEAEKAMWLAVSADASAGNKDALEMMQKAQEGASAATLFRIPNGAARFVHLRKIIENAALMDGPDDSAGMDDFEARFEATRPEPWVVFCQFKQSCEILVNRLRDKFDVRAEVYNGDVDPRDRTELEDKFQRGEIDVLVGTTAAMGTGITLTRSHLMYFLSRDVVPARDEQAEGREDRKGQQQLVRVFIAQPDNTVATDSVQPKVELKEGIVGAILDQDSIEQEVAA